MPEKVRVHILVSGLVQGVFFRAHTRKKAQELGIKGWVKNLGDGRVEAIFEGDEEMVREMLNWAKKGPSRAQVDGFEEEFEDYKGEFEDFEIRYV
ncbi:acylphosphatase [Parcubacteria bacterium DG_74_3]|nr:MAG: acylphosphatase [Parcubacteria bacterium DG_74_3]